LFSQGKGKKERNKGWKEMKLTKGFSFSLLIILPQRKSERGFTCEKFIDELFPPFKGEFLEQG
jgi:hypothetical protein